MVVEHITEPSEELYLAFLKLIPQLTTNHPAPSRAEVEQFVTSPGSILLVARHPDETGPIVGVATLVIFRVPTGLRALLEDVIVDKEARGLGIGAALTRAALEQAKHVGADGISLTSHPGREAANKLYQKMGFKRWETNLYFFKFQED